MFSPAAGPAWRGHLIALLAGASTPLSLAPFNFWPLALIGIGLLSLLLQGLSARASLVRAAIFGLGLFGTGASWVFVSIHDYGNSSLPLALVLTLIFVAALSLIFALPFYAHGRWFSHRPLAALAAFPALWVLGEWLRSWFLTGFPWLYLGYGHLDTPLAGWAPVGGVFALSLVCALTAAALAQALCGGWRQGYTLCALALVAALWLGGWGLQQQNWTQPQGDKLQVGLVQPNIPQEMKWRPDFRQPTLDRLRAMSEPLWDHDWVIWSEAAVPMLYHHAGAFLSEMQEQAATTNTALITGILYDDYQKRQYYNSVLGLGTALGIYHKQRLVPFGEYVPLESWLRGLIAFFDLPTSVISTGPKQQRPLQIGNLFLSPSICYEVVYPDLVAEGATAAHVLLTISNDAWFGDSIGPLQHMEMAQMRALETGRYMIRATNNGVSGIVAPDGRLLQQTDQFKQQTLSAEIQPMKGSTPFMNWGSWPVVGCTGLLLLLALVYQPAPAKHSRQRRSQTA